MRLAMVALVVAGCGSDGDGKAVDAPKPGDARVVDAGPDAPPDAQPDVRVVDCAATQPVATFTSEAGINAFMPDATTIAVGQVIAFEMAQTHNVVPVASDPGLTVGFGQTKCLLFAATGTYNFKCGPHGSTGSITVDN